MTKYGDAMIHVRRRNGSEHVSVSAVDALTLKQIWRTDIGGPLAGSPIKMGNDLVAISSQGDLFTIDISANFSENAVKSSTIAENLLFDRVIPLSDTTAVCVGPAGRADILHVDIAGKTSKKLPLQKPADQAACRPIRQGNNLIVASRQGQVMRVNPKTGGIVGTPFLPPVKPGVETDWKDPVIVRENKLIIGAGRGVFFMLDCEDPRSIRKQSELPIDSSVKSGCVAIGDTVYAVVGSQAADELIAIGTTGELSKAGSFPLSSGIAAGPWAVGESVLLRLDNDALVCFDSSLKQKWSVQLQNDKLATPPYANGTNISLVFRSGKLFDLDANSGQVASEIDLGQPVIHAPLIDGGKAYFSGYDGTIHVTQLPQ